MQYVVWSVSFFITDCSMNKSAVKCCLINPTAERLDLLKSSSQPDRWVKANKTAVKVKWVSLRFIHLCFLWLSISVHNENAQDWGEWVRSESEDQEWEVVKFVYYSVLPLIGGNVKTFTGLICKDYFFFFAVDQIFTFSLASPPNDTLLINKMHLY